MKIVFKLLAVSALCAIMPQTLHAEDVKTSLDSREGVKLSLDKKKKNPQLSVEIVYDRKTKTFRYNVYVDGKKVLKNGAPR